MSSRFFALASLLLFFSSTVLASGSCLVNVQGALFYFNYKGRDYSAGKYDSCDSQATQSAILPVDGRPSFDGLNVNCYYFQDKNTVFVVGASAANPGEVFTYDVSAAQWSTQMGTGKPPAAAQGFQGVACDDKAIYAVDATNQLYTLQTSADTWSLANQATVPQTIIAQLVPPVGSKLTKLTPFKSGTKEKVVAIGQDGTEIYDADGSNSSPQIGPRPPDMDTSSVYAASANAIFQANASGKLLCLDIPQLGTWKALNFDPNAIHNADTFFSEVIKKVNSAISHE